MSSINASEYVLLDNAKNATMTPLQTTPSLTPSESLSPALLPVLASTPTPNVTAISTSNAATQSSSSVSLTGIQSYESFARDLELKRLEWYLEATALAKCTGDRAAERTNSQRARSLIEQLYPSQNASSILSIRLSKYLLKHSRPDLTLTVLNGVTQTETELPGVQEKDDKITHWYYKAITALELPSSSNPENSGVEGVIKNGMIEAVGYVDLESRKTWINVGYFLMSVSSLLKNDEVDARFWKNQLPAGYTLPDGIHSSHLQRFTNLTLAQLPVSSSGSVQTERDVSQLDGLTPTDILMRDVMRLKSSMNEIYDTVYMNYKEMNERIKSIHTILDGRENVSGQDLEELKKRMDYLERMTLRG
ncbi:hypothetical protein TWF718_005371 [Orbilia javanica]|uniref:Uncharacterized protein n=1 Tax=Orbilia javanica TaxID=47235 RepID=A0AAN8RE65_9PEZI